MNTRSTGRCGRGCRGDGVVPRRGLLGRAPHGYWLTGGWDRDLSPCQLRLGERQSARTVSTATASRMGRRPSSRTWRRSPTAGSRSR